MTQEKNEEKKQRLAKALRNNLRRRKSAQREDGSREEDSADRIAGASYKASPDPDKN